MVKFDGGGEIYLECDGQRLPEFKVDSENGAPITGLPSNNLTKATHAKVAYIPAQRGKSFCIVGAGFRLPLLAADKVASQPIPPGKTLRVTSDVWSQGLYCGGVTHPDPDLPRREDYHNNGTKYTFEFTEQTTGPLPRKEGEDGELDTTSLTFHPAELVVAISAWEHDPSQPLVPFNHVVTGELHTIKKGSKAHALGCGASGKAAGSAAGATKAQGQRRLDLPVYRVKFLLSSARLLMLQGIMPDEDFPAPQPVSNQDTSISSPSRRAKAERSTNLRSTRSATRARDAVDDDEDDDDDGNEVVHTSTRSPRKRPRRSIVIDLTID